MHYSAGKLTRAAAAAAEVAAAAAVVSHPFAEEDRSECTLLYTWYTTRNVERCYGVEVTVRPFPIHVHR